MIGIDTNVLLRFILADHPVQFERAKAFLGERSSGDPAFVSLVVLAEACWVLRRRYGYQNDVIASAFRQLLGVEELQFEDEFFVDSLMIEERNLADDISNYIIAYTATRAGCTKSVTFDHKAAKSVPGMELLQ